MVDMGMGAWMVAGRGFDGVLNFTCARVWCKRGLDSADKPSTSVCAVLSGWP
jgi:hypothetical protein